MISQTSSTLRRDGAEAAPELISELRRRHPDASNGMIMNYLITAYCSEINGRSDLREGQKRADLRRFNRDVGKLLFK